MAVTDYNKEKPLDVDSVSGTPTVGKAQPVLLSVQPKGTGTTQSEPDSGSTTVTESDFNTYVDLKSDAIITTVGFESDRSIDVTIAINRESDGKKLAEKTVSATAGEWTTVSFTGSDYDDLPKSTDTLRIDYVAPSSDLRTNDETRSNSLFDIVTGTRSSLAGINSSSGGVAVEAETADYDDSVTGNGDIVLDWSNIADAQDIAVYDQNDNLLDYEIEELDTAAETGVLWVYDSWVRDGTTQAKVVYGNGPAGSEENVTGTWNNTGQNALMVQHLQDDPLTATDSTSNNNDGTVTGAVSTSGQFDGGAEFDGTDDRIETTYNLNDEQTNFTIISYANFDDLSSDRTILGSFDGSKALEFRTNVNQNLQMSFFDTGGAATSSTSLQTNTDYHLIGTYNSSNGLKVFIDSVEEGSDSNTSFDANTDNEWIGGRSDGSKYMDGTISEIRVYEETKSNDWIQADYDASPEAGQVFFSQQAAQQTVTNQTASIPVTQNTQTTPTPQLQPEPVSVSTPTTVLTQTTENLEVQPGTAPMNIQETQLTVANPDINLQPGESRVQVISTTLNQTTENPAVNATFDLSVPETQLTVFNPDPTLTVGQTILAPETQLTHTTPDIQVVSGNSPITVSETQLTATNPEIGLNRRIVFGVVTQLTTENPEPNLEPGIVQLNVQESQLTQTTVNPQVVPGETELQVTPLTELQVATPDIQLIPGNTDLGIDETTLLQVTPEPSVGLDLQFVSPTNALITNKNRYFDMADHTFKQNDFGDSLTATLKDEDNPNGVDIKGNTKVTLVVETADEEKVLDKEMKVTDAANGKVEYDWENGDFIEDVGVYRAEIKVFDATDEPETFPNNGYRSVTVEDELE